ncbi:biopolymer transport protein ExbD [Prosthecobacter fusiformis]|uniref:Biopolymer transport protein ExbD n=1 Tax=Prosthecobacter fusiformis TaxID=48464 RepID=A0A4R7S4A3_9BACT|nr:biopolymer transporter ExbD [Prosthecobacter fusiformis]TDU73154.1 biopolymer transport protein ExbD [Prosthecobacter fusiformis]
MKRASQRHLPLYMSQVSITALLDLVLVLLLVFVVAVPIFRREKPAGSADVQTVLPTEPKGPATQVELNIQPDESILLDGRKVSGAELLPELKKLLVAQPELGVVVKMPANFAAGPLARLMDEMNRAGVRHTAVEVVDAKKP